MNALDSETLALVRRAESLVSRRLFEEAVMILSQVVETTPSHRTRSWLVGALIASGRTEEAVKQATSAIQSYPRSWETQDALGRALVARGDYNGAVRAFETSAALRWRPVQGPAHYVLHNLEQMEYLSRNIELYPGLLNIGTDTSPDKAPAEIIDGQEEVGNPKALAPDVNSNKAVSLPFFIPKGSSNGQPLNTALNLAMISAKFVENDESFVIIDDLLSDSALESLRHFCLGATVWRRPYVPGYVGAFPEDGFASVLLFEIADALRQAMPDIFAGHRLQQWWAFSYDQQLSGTDVHADDADLSVNLWITPTEANLQRDRGGLIMWDRSAQADWTFQDYNGDSDKIRSWLAEVGANQTIVPHRANRAVLFRGHLLHRSDGTSFASGYENRRRNITFLFHRTP